METTELEVWLTQWKEELEVKYEPSLERIKEKLGNDPEPKKKLEEPWKLT